MGLGYDAAGRRTSLTLPNGIVVNYAYDQASQLTGLSYSLAANPLGNLAYGYDNDGRRVQLSGSWARTGIPNATTSTAVYNVANELTGWNGATLSYDSNGNLMSDGTNSYSWDSRNQLSGISGVTTASFVYDPFGRRQGKTIGSATTSFLYDGVNPVQELVGGGASANLLTGLGVDEYFSRTDALSSGYFLTDALGSTLALADGTGAVQTQYTYEPFGGTTTQGASSASSFQFTGRENDGTGLYFYRARYYSPTLQRFVSEDPIGFGGGINVYGYGGNDPVGNIDPSGLYTSYWHRYITNDAAREAGMSREAAQALADAVAAVDGRPGAQRTDAQDTNAHAMAGRKPNGKEQTCQGAYEGTQRELGDAMHSGDIAKALHIIEDATAPAHRDYQPWYGAADLEPAAIHLFEDTDPGGVDPLAVPQGVENSERFLNDLLHGRLDSPMAYLPQAPCGQ